MGGSGGGSYSPTDFADLERAILKRLKGVAKDANKIVFACEEADLGVLTTLMDRSGYFVGEKIEVACGTDASIYAELVENSQLLVTFTERATDCRFLNDMVEIAFSERKQGIHAKGNAGAQIPTKVLAYRWRSMSWDDLVELLR